MDSLQDQMVASSTSMAPCNGEALSLYQTGGRLAGGSATPKAPLQR
jgi:hypothetical protein